MRIVSFVKRFVVIAPRFGLEWVLMLRKWLWQLVWQVSASQVFDVCFGLTFRRKSAVDTLTKKTDTEKMLDEALSKKNWGASSTLMNDLARLTEDRWVFHADSL